MVDVIGFGYCCVDFVGVVTSIPGVDETAPILEATKEGGGVAATAMVTIARLGGKASFIGCIGNDENGRFVVSGFKKESVDVSNMIIVPGLNTAFSYVLIDKATGKRTIAFYYDPVILKYLIKANLKSITEAKILHLDGPYEAAIKAAKIAKEHGVTVTYDNAGYGGTEYNRILKYIDVFIPSVSVSRQLTGKKDPVEAAKHILHSGPSIVGITLGNEGSICVTKDEVIKKPAFKVKVKDTLGAGDVYHGAFIYGLLQKWPLDSIVEFSNAVSAIKCQKLGGRAGIPNLSQVAAFLKKHGKKVP